MKIAVACICTSHDLTWSNIEAADGFGRMGRAERGLPVAAFEYGWQLRQETEPT